MALALGLILSPLSTTASAATIIVSPGSGVPGTVVSVSLVDFPPCNLLGPDPSFCVSENMVNVYFGTSSTPVGQAFAPAGFMFFPNPITFSVPALSAGTYAVTAIDAVGRTATASFDVEVPAKTDQTITFAALEDKIYGDPDFSLSATASSGLPVRLTAEGNCSVVAGPTAHILGTGDCAITASQLGNETYNEATPVTQSFNIDRRPASVTPDAAAKTYGAPDPVLTGVLSGFLAADGVTATYIRTAGESVGSYTISATLNPASQLVNYSITHDTATFTISISPTSLCELTTEYVHSSAKYVALPQHLRVQADSLVTQACTKLSSLSGATRFAAADIATYKRVVEVLRLTGYLTSDQAVFLKNGADQL